MTESAPSLALYGAVAFVVLVPLSIAIVFALVRRMRTDASDPKGKDRTD